MKKVFLVLILLIQSTVSFSQSDTLVFKKENRFKVAKSVLVNSVLSVPGDFVEMGHNVSSNWKRTAAYTGGILGLIAVDKYTTGFLHDTFEPNVDYQLPKIDVLNTGLDWADGNNAYILYPILGLYAGSFIANDYKGQQVAINAVKAVTYSYVISHLLLKALVGRNRPQRSINDDKAVLEPWTKDQWDFGNFHPVYFPSRADGTAFPSFHATFYFSVAKVFQMEYNNYWIPYTFATGVFLADMKGHEHWVSDLIVGGLVGTIIGRSVVRSSHKQIEKSNHSIGYNPNKFKMTKQLIPQITTSQVGLHFIGSF